MAIGPQNTERDNGVIARMAAIAVTTSGRDLCLSDTEASTDDRSQTARCHVGIDP